MHMSWGQVIVASLALMVTILAIVWRRGLRDGKLDTILENLQKIVQDHEMRLRKGRL